MLNWLSFSILALGLIWSIEVRADALGTTDAVEIAKLTRIITQMTELLEKTQAYLDVQQRLTDMQERSFFRKAQAYGQEVRNLVEKQVILEETARDLQEDPFHLQRMQYDVQLIRERAARINDGDTKENLLGLADSLEFIGTRQWLVGTARRTMMETANAADSNTEDQLLAGIFFAIAQLQETVGLDTTARRMKEKGAQWKMQGSYSVFRRRGDEN